MNMCLYEPMNGSLPDCKGNCKRGKDSLCPWYYEDKIMKIILQWKKDAGIDTPVLWRFDKKRNKLCLFTTKPGYMIGKDGNRYNKFWNQLKEAEPRNYFIQNGIDIIEVDDGV